MRWFIIISGLLVCCLVYALIKRQRVGSQSNKYVAEIHNILANCSDALELKRISERNIALHYNQNGENCEFFFSASPHVYIQMLILLQEDESLSITPIGSQVLSQFKITKKAPSD